MKREKRVMADERVQVSATELERAALKHVFISYSRRDLAYVRRLAVYLERQGIRVWYDYKIETGERFSGAIQTAIDECYAFALIVTKASGESEWVNKEIDRAAQGKKRLIPLLLEQGAKAQHIDVSSLNRDDVTRRNMPSEKTIELLRRLSRPPDPTKTPAASVTEAPVLTAVAAARLKTTGVRLWRRWRSLSTALLLGGLLTALALGTGRALHGSWLVAAAVVGAVVAAVTCVAVDRRTPTLTHFRRDPAATPRVPPGQSQFRGRNVELDAWHRVHNKAREARSTAGTDALGPVVLAIHGAAGVGKSAFAHALANKLREGYPDGYFMVAFGAGGTARSPADISRDLLLQLGWMPEDMPDETEDRVATLRSLTRDKRMLFLFDAARDHDQVRQVIPAEPGCAVIITSRREIASALGLAPQQALGRTSLGTSFAIFTAFSGYEWTRSPEEVVNVVELCGRLPLAIRSAAEQFRDGTDMRRLIDRLRHDSSRLAVLNYGGSAVEERVGSEFFRLLSEQRRALTLLAHLNNDTFVSWVLRPMMNINKGEAASLVASLASAQLIEEFDQDAPGRPRYRMNPLVRLFARGRVGTVDSVISPEEIEAATARLAAGYVTVIGEVLAIHDATYPADPAADPSGHDAAVQQVAGSLEQHVRREYGTLLWLLDSELLTPKMLWRCVVNLTAAVAPLRTMSEMKEVFKKARTAAKTAGTDPSVVDVLLAEAAYLFAAEDYATGHAVVEDALGLLSEAWAPAEHQARRLRATRIRAGAHLQVAAYNKAATELNAAFDQIAALTDVAKRLSTVQTDARLLRLYSMEARVPPAEDEPWSFIDDAATASGTMVDFRAALLRSEDLRSRESWHDAASELRLEERNRAGDTRSLAVIWYRLARLQIEEALAAEWVPNGSERRVDPRREAVHLAAECAWTFDTIGDEIGQIRARCLLVRALVLTRQLVPATRICYETNKLLKKYWDGRENEPYVLSLRARFARALGELQFEYGAYQQAWNSLQFAATTFHDLDDWANRDQIWQQLEKIDTESAGMLTNILTGLHEL